MTAATQIKLRLCQRETADALDQFFAMSEPATVADVARIRRILCSVTSKLVSVESEIAAGDERRRS